jgi:hypothetical protein
MDKPSEPASAAEPEVLLPKPQPGQQARPVPPEPERVRLPTRPVFGSWRPIAWVLAAALGGCWAGLARGAPPDPRPWTLIGVLLLCVIACAVDARVDARMSHEKKQLERKGRPVPGPAYDYLPPGGRIIFSGGVLLFYSVIAALVFFVTA